MAQTEMIARASLIALTILSGPGRVAAQSGQGVEARMVPLTLAVVTLVSLTAVADVEVEDPGQHRLALW